MNTMHGDNGTTATRLGFKFWWRPLTRNRFSLLPARRNKEKKELVFSRFFAQVDIGNVSTHPEIAKHQQSEM